MFEIDKVKFGAFVAALRKERGLTQRELAERLCISDKAVSKWETGNSIPDVTMLIPLAELLGVTVTELLECKRMEVEPPVEAVVKKAVSYAFEDAPKIPKKRRVAAVVGAVLLGLGEFCGIMWLEGGYTVQLNYLLVMLILGVVFSGYFWLLARERLPSYYDENRISAYADGFFRMNMAGVTFNNRNWPYILKVGRLWTLALLDVFPAVYYGGMRMFGETADSILIVGILLTLVLPLYYVARKYE
ncbi:MAG: helix-turn-helix transcriptional regulator [Oscillospiraceae bacterium]|nr:helix-turn-helix transcriptional regulator [Oscillospiraceae bacterium]